MKLLNFGSLNYDHVYRTNHFVQPKETLPCLSYIRNFGGKGLNQSIASAKAGLEVYHAGRVGMDGDDLIAYLNQYNVHTDYLMKDISVPTGHAIIEVCNGQNRIITNGGANHHISKEQIADTISAFDSNDILLIQNEINFTGEIISAASEKGMKIVFNLAPFTEDIFNYPLHLVDIIIVNEVEAAALCKTDSTDPDELIKLLLNQYPKQTILLTLGDQGSYCLRNGETLFRECQKVEVVDTTAAGDTYSGFFLSSYYLFDPENIKIAMDLATIASGITVSREGAAIAIPSLKEVMTSYENL